MFVMQSVSLVVMWLAVYRLRRTRRELSDVVADYRRAMRYRDHYDA